MRPEIPSLCATEAYFQCVMFDEVQHHLIPHLQLVLVHALILLLVRYVHPSEKYENPVKKLNTIVEKLLLIN